MDFWKELVAVDRAVALIFILFAGWKGYWVFGSTCATYGALHREQITLLQAHYTEYQRRSDDALRKAEEAAARFETIALRSLNITQNASVALKDIAVKIDTKATE